MLTGHVLGTVFTTKRDNASQSSHNAKWEVDDSVLSFLLTLCSPEILPVTFWAGTLTAQIWLQPNRYYDIDRLQAEVDDTIKLENVLLVKDENGTTLSLIHI